jgi:pyruvate dehydrogenase E2 component (dihydrolipoamide acetyltransferase)
MPSLGADMIAGTIIEWLVKPGDLVKRGDIIAVVDTEKATIEVEIFSAGIIESIFVPAGQKVPVGTPLAQIRDGEAPPPPREVTKSLVTEAAPAVAPTSTAVPTIRPPEPFGPEIRHPAAAPAKAAPAGPRRLRISPVAMRMALEMHIDLSMVKGTGPGGAIGKTDIERAIKCAIPAPAPVVAPLPTVAAQPAVLAPRGTMAPEERTLAMRRAIAAAMTRSKREIPHYYLGTSIDMTTALAWLAAENLKRSVDERVLYSALLLKAVALAGRQIPEMNGFWQDERFQPSEAVHVGVAISLRQGGLIAPALHDVDKKNLNEIMASFRDLVKRVRAGVLRSSEIADATITVSSLAGCGKRYLEGPSRMAIATYDVPTLANITE